MPPSSRLAHLRFSPHVARCVSLAALLLSLSATSATAGKKVPSTAWVVLVHTAGDAPSAWVEPLQKATQAAAADRKWVSPPTTTFDELQVALGCADWDAACANLIADSVGAGSAVVVTMNGSDGGVAVDVSVVGPGGAPIAGAERLTLATKTESDLHAVERWVGAVVRGARPAVLVVSSDVPGDEVLLDGVLVGHTPVTVVDVVPGAHALQVRRAGRAPAQRSITVAAGATVREDVALGAVAPMTTTTPTVGTGAAPGAQTSSATAWGLVGVGGLVTVVGGVLATVNGLPVLEASLNQTDGKLNRAYQPLLYGDPVVGEDRFAFLAKRFWTETKDVQDPESFARTLDRATTLANVGLVLVAAGAALTATGIGLGLAGGDEAPSTTPPVASPPSTAAPPTPAPGTTAP